MKPKDKWTNRLIKANEMVRERDGKNQVSLAKRCGFTVLWLIL
jgi:hypothetical protein